MIECPKCHFVQPKDEFCAKCGIEVSAYKAPPPTLGQSVARKPLHTSLAILALVLVASYFLFPKNKMFSRFVPRLLVSESTNGVAEPGIQEQALSSESLDEATESDEVSAESATGAVTDSGVKALAASGVSLVDSSATSGNQVILTMAEVPIEQIQALIESGDNLGTVIKSLDQVAGLAPSAKVLAALNTSQILVTKALMIDGPKETNWFWGQQDNQGKSSLNNLGFWSHFEIVDFDGTTLKGNFSSDRYLRDPGAPPEINSTQKMLAAAIEISQGTQFFMTQILPVEFKSNVLQGRYDLSKNEVFKIFNSEKFGKSQSDLVLFIQLKKDQSLTK